MLGAGDNRGFGAGGFNFSRTVFDCCPALSLMGLLGPQNKLKVNEQMNERMNECMNE